MSTQTKWTPGPWREGLHGAIVADGKANCDEATAQFYGGPTFICESVTGANARLISKSPQMAELLREMSVVIRDLADRLHSYGTPVSLVLPVKAERILRELEG